MWPLGLAKVDLIVRPGLEDPRKGVFLCKPRILQMKLVAIYSSAPRSGKSTVASILDKKHGFKVISFAAPVKYISAYLLTKIGYSHSEAFRLAHVDKEDLIPELGVTSRYIQQRIGTDLGRHMIADDLWLKIAKVSILKHE